MELFWVQTFWTGSKVLKYCFPISISFVNLNKFRSGDSTDTNSEVLRLTILTLKLTYIAQRENVTTNYDLATQMFLSGIIITVYYK